MCDIDPIKLRLLAPIFRKNVWVMLAEAASVTFAVKARIPIAVGVPVIEPRFDSDNPGGSVPEIKDHE